MSEPSITIRMHDNSRVFSPGATLAGDYWLESVDREEVRSIEVSILWYTEGKGDEEISVHDFRILSVEEGDAIDPATPGHFHTVLPQSPLSYEGAIVKIRWCVRVRAYLTRGRELVEQKRFRLGSVMPARAIRHRGTAETPAAS